MCLSAIIAARFIRLNRPYLFVFKGGCLFYVALVSDRASHSPRPSPPPSSSQVLELQAYTIMAWFSCFKFKKKKSVLGMGLSTLKEILFYLFIITVCIHDVSGGGNACRGKRINWWNQFSSTILWILRLKVRLPNLLIKYITHWGTGPASLILKEILNEPITFSPSDHFCQKSYDN